MLINKKFIKEKSSYMFLEYVKNDEKYKILSHFRRTPSGWLLLLKIMERFASDKNLYVEELIREIPNKVCSRLSAFAIIDSAVKKGILEKKNCNKDRRKKEIIPSQLFINEYIDWLGSFTLQLDHKRKNDKELKQSNID